MESSKIDIAIVDDHALFRNGVVALTSEFKELRMVFQAENGEHMQRMLATSPSPQVILIDTNMQVKDGYSAIKWLKANHPGIKVLALNMFENDKAVIQMIECGAFGYILKESKPRELLTAITTVIEKGSFLNELVSGKLIRYIADKTEGPEFSKNELGFLKLCCSELTYKEIADQMYVSPRTVDNYRESLFLKLKLKSRTGLVLYAIKNGIFHFN